MNITSGFVEAHQDGAIGWLIWNKPAKLNALSTEMILDAIEVLQVYEASATVRVVIMRGAGEKAFISGGDISGFDQARKTPEAEKKYHEAPDRLEAGMIALSKPIIAMIHGYCLGGGLRTALSADMRFASSTARLGVPAAKRGLAYPITTLSRLRELVGPSRARDLLFSGRQLPVDEGYRIGLVDRIFAPGDLERETVEYAREVAENAPLSVRAAKFGIEQAGLHPSHRNDEEIAALSAACSASEDFKEATKAFMEKRKPVFRGM